MIFIIKGFRTIVFVFIVNSTTFRSIRPPAFFRCLLSKFLRRSLLIFIIKGFRTIVFVFIVNSTTFRSIRPPAFFRCLLSKFLRRSLLIFIIKGFRTIVFVFIVNSTTFRSIRPPAFFRCLSNSGTFTELRTTSFIESTGVACSDSVSHNRGFNKERNSKFREGSRVQQTPEEGQRTYRPKRCGNNNKDEDNSPKTLNDKNQPRFVFSFFV